MDWVHLLGWDGLGTVLSYCLGLSVGFSSGSGDNQGIRGCLRGLVHELSKLGYVCTEEYGDRLFLYYCSCDGQ